MSQTIEQEQSTGQVPASTSPEQAQNNSPQLQETLLTPKVQEQGAVQDIEQAPPPLSPTDYALNLPDNLNPEEIDGEMFGRFKSFCAGTGLSPAQAQKAINFYFNEQNTAMESMGKNCETMLRERWKEGFSTNIAKARQACASLNQKMGGRLAGLLNSGLGNHPVIAELMATVGNSMAEDSFGAVSGGGVPNEAMTTEEYLRQIVFKNK